MYLFFSFFLDTLSFCIPVLWPFSGSKHCTYISVIYMIMLLSFHRSLHVSLFFSLYTHVSINVCNLLFLFLFFVVTLSFWTLVLWQFSDNKHCTYLSFIYMMMLLSFHLSLHVLFLFSLYTHVSINVCNLLFLFHTKMPWWVLFKVFQNDRLSKSIMPWTLFLQSFSRVCIRIRFYCTQQVILSLVIYDFSHTSFVYCGFVIDY